jgi:hypothetical protein
MFVAIRKFLKSLSLIEGKTERFFSHILVPLWILTLYFLLSSGFLSSGINTVFLTRSGKYLFWGTSALSLIFFFILGIKKEKLLLIGKPEEKLPLNSLILLLLPLTPISQYILNNLEILSLSDAIYVFFVFTIFIAFFVLFTPILFQKVSSNQILMFVGVAFTFSIINMGALSRQFTWHEKGSLKIQLLIFSGVFFLIWIFSYIKKQKLLYTLIVILFLSTSITPFIETNKKTTDSLSPETDNKLMALVNSQRPKHTPSIYLLIYDAYVPNETMLAYGIDNQAQEKYLDELGFQIYPQTYSIGSDSIGTMSRVFNASTEYYGISRRGISGDGVVQNLLKDFGYKTYGIFSSGYYFRGTTSSYDYTIPSYTIAPKNILVQAIFTGEFQFDIGFDAVSEKQFAIKKAKLFSEKTNSPRFAYVHTSKPSHSQNSGACLANELELFDERLQKANLYMKEDLSVLLANDPNAIIIIAGDHGPYLTKNCYGTGGAWVPSESDAYDISEISRLDIQDRFGTFLAIKWPIQDFEEYDDIIVLQDLFPAIFAYLYQDQQLLEAKVNPVTVETSSISNARVIDGIIEGGIHDGEPLFIGETE